MNRTRIIISAILSLLIVSSNAQNKAKVVIVGAGLSGISAFSVLDENGINDIVVLEAEDRIGGRIHSVPWADGVIDLGGQWITGEQGNVIFEMAKNNSATLGSTQEAEPDFYTSRGNRPPKMLTNYLKSLGDEIMSDFPAMLKFNGSLGSYFLERFWKDPEIKLVKKMSPELPQQIVEYYEYCVNNWNGSESWFDVSAPGNAIFKTHGGDQFVTWGNQGFITFFKFLLKNRHDPVIGRSIDILIDGRLLELDSRILLNHRVDNIAYSLTNESQKIIVRTSQGVTWEADHVICTVSLGVLKRYHYELFEPDLPKRQIEGIEKMGFGTFGKVFLEFAEPFWPTNTSEWATYDFLWNSYDKKKIIGTSREWLMSMRIIGYVDAFPNLLEAELGGRGMETFELSSDKEVLDSVMWLLRKFVNQSIPDPVNMIKTKWKTKKNFFGSYSYESTAAYDAGIFPKTLGKTIEVNGKPVILFAGEAYHQDYASLTQGAVMSGFDKAKEILNFTKK